MKQNKCTLVAQNEESGQKIEVKFELLDSDLKFDVAFNPPLEDPDYDLGLAGLIIGNLIALLKGDGVIEMDPDSPMNEPNPPMCKDSE